MPTTIPVTTLSNLRDNFVPPSLSDLLYLQQGSEHDRDSAGSLEEILESQVIQSFLNDRDNWRTFTPSEAGIITLGEYQRNVIIVPSAKDQAVRLDHFPTNGLIIYAPDWEAENAVTAINISEINDINRRFTITKGGVGVFYSFGPDQPIIGQSLIGSSDLSLAVLKKLNVDKLIVESDVVFRYGSNVAFGIHTEERVVNETTYYDLVITKVNDSRKIKILGDTFQVVAYGINPGDINFNDGLKNFWGEFDGDGFKTLNAEHINSDLVSSKRRVYKDVDNSGSGDSSSASQTQYETSLGHSTSFYHLGGGATIFTFDKTTCEIGEEVLLFKPSSTSIFIKYNKDDDDVYSSREIEGSSLIKMVYLGLNSFGNPWWHPLALTYIPV
jgi:hypothetical protein